MIKNGVTIKVIKGKSGELVGYFLKENTSKKNFKRKLGFFNNLGVTIKKETSNGQMKNFNKKQKIMRKIIVGSFITLDGVVQAAGGPEEGFKYGGWSAPYYDEALDTIAEKQKRPAKDILLGRKTFEIFASFFPDRQDIWPGVNDATKYVMSNTLKRSDTMKMWNNSVVIKSVEEIFYLKNSEGTDIQVHGSGNLVQTLLKHNLVDELWLLIHPVTLGIGNKLFAEGTISSAFTLVECTSTPSGVIAAHYVHAEEVKTGSMGD